MDSHPVEEDLIIRRRFSAKYITLEKSTYAFN